MKNGHQRSSYSQFFHELARLEAHQIGEYYWILRSENSIENLTAKLWSLVDSDDCIFVSALSSTFRYVNAETGTNAWIRKFVGSGTKNLVPPPDLYIGQRQVSPREQRSSSAKYGTH
jgi:hypothetical protein